jgi:uncharacterized membrane protein
MYQFKEVDMKTTVLALFIMCGGLTIFAVSRPSNATSRTFFVLMLAIDVLVACLGLSALLFGR